MTQQTVRQAIEQIIPFEPCKTHLLAELDRRGLAYLVAGGGEQLAINMAKCAVGAIQGEIDRVRHESEVGWEPGKKEYLRIWANGMNNAKRILQTVIEGAEKSIAASPSVRRREPRLKYLDCYSNAAACGRDFPVNSYGPATVEVLEAEMEKIRANPLAGIDRMEIVDVTKGQNPMPVQRREPENEPGVRGSMTEEIEKLKQWAIHNGVMSDDRGYHSPTILVLIERLESFTADRPSPSPEPVVGEPTKPMTGAELITAERRRQIESEGWDAHHDSQHEGRELLEAAVCYIESWHYSDPQRLPTRWPWDAKWWKPKDSLRNLIRAGALIAAEIDRQQRRFGTLSPQPPRGPEVVKCERCKGSGLIQAGGTGEADDRRCPDCAGTGRTPEGETT